MGTTGNAGPASSPARVATPPAGAFGPPGSPARRRSKAILGATAVVLITLVGGTMALPGFLPMLRSGPAPGGTSTDGPLPPALPPTASCNPSHELSPASLVIPAAGPRTTLPAGGRLTVTYEVGEPDGSVAGPVGIHVPSVFAFFPLQNGSRATVYAAPSVLVLNGGGWSPGGSVSASISPSSSLTFATGANATLTSEKIALMGNRSYGNLTILVRWHWSIASPGAPAVDGNWTVPTPRAQYPTALATEFFPVPYAALDAVAASPYLIGTTFWANLSGAVAGRYFFLELEQAADGKVVQAVGETAPADAATFRTTIPLLNYDHYLAPAAFLVHIHDICGAILYSVPVTVTYAASATVTIGIHPPTCGTVTLAGRSYGSGSEATLAPSSTAYSFGLSGCWGYSFRDWNTTGGLYIPSSGSLLVSASGTFDVDYQ